jgi:ribose/xylose/arabinose/galactoside ABC-type transport system permease subunit
MNAIRSQNIRKWILFVGLQNLSLIFTLIVLLIFFGTLRSDVFFSPRNLMNIVNSVAILGIVAMAQTIVIVSGGIDISVGSIAGLASVAAAAAMVHVDNAALGVFVAIAVGIIAGSANGLLITYGKVNAIIATLGTLSVFKGLAFILSNGPSIAITNANYNFLGSGRILDVPMPVYIALAVGILLQILTARTDVGRNIYAMGGSPTAAHLAGINTAKYRLFVYALCGAASGIAAVILSARATTAMPASGSEGLELEAITAAFLGGCALSGGRGTMFGAVLGVMVIGTLNNGMILLQVPTFYQLLAKGTLLIGAVLILEARRPRQA